MEHVAIKTPVEALRAARVALQKAVRYGAEDPGMPVETFKELLEVQNEVIVALNIHDAGWNAETVRQNVEIARAAA